MKKFHLPKNLLSSFDFMELVVAAQVLGIKMDDSDLQVFIKIKFHHFGRLGHLPRGKTSQNLEMGEKLV